MPYTLYLPLLLALQQPLLPNGLPANMESIMERYWRCNHTVSLHAEPPLTTPGTPRLVAALQSRAAGVGVEVQVTEVWTEAAGGGQRELRRLRPPTHGAGAMTPNSD